MTRRTALTLVDPGALPITQQLVIELTGTLTTLNEAVVAPGDTVQIVSGEMTGLNDLIATANPPAGAAPEIVIVPTDVPPP
jgi:hypothetical protein